MPTYSWFCRTCDQDTECTRPSKDIDLKPDNGCVSCGSTAHLERVIRPKPSKVKGFILEGGGWHDTDYTKTRSRH